MITINPEHIIIGLVSFIIGMGVGAGIKWFVEMVWKIINRFIFGDK